MNDKVLVSVMLPATQKSYDLWVPLESSVHDACALVADILESREADRFSATSSSALMLRDTGEMVDPNCLVESAGWVNGTRLVLI